MTYRPSRRLKLSAILAILSATMFLMPPNATAADECGGENEMICAWPSLGCEDEDEQDRACEETCGADWEAVDCDEDSFCGEGYDTIVCKKATVE